MSRALQHIDGANLSVNRQEPGNSLLYYLHGNGLPVPDSLLTEAYGPERIDRASVV